LTSWPSLKFTAINLPVSCERTVTLEIGVTLPMARICTSIFFAVTVSASTGTGAATFFVSLPLREQPANKTAITSVNTSTPGIIMIKSFFFMRLAFALNSFCAGDLHRLKGHG
jgi:hypothetical protein